MTELFEQINMGASHNPDKCPFCPKKKNDEHYKTYGGADNDGGKLGDLVNEPKKFGTSKEADARPKDGKEGKDCRQNQSLSESESLNQVKSDDLKWTFQAHHAISGNQCLKGDPVEKFIKEGDKVKYDTGYSVNNPQNGVWLPSSPVATKWPDDPARKFALATEAMEKFKRQFHLGHHNIAVDVDGLDPKTDRKYVDYVKGKLKDLHTVLSAWEVCPEKDKEKKHIGNPRIHVALDHLSDHIIKILKGTPRKWNIFISRHARDYTIKARNPSAKLDFEK